MGKKMGTRIIVIGGGPGGYSAAIRGADLGAEVTLVEEAELGGACLNRGCVPTKIFLEAAELVHNLKGSDRLGIQAEPCIELASLVRHKMKVVSDLRSSLGKLLSSRGVKVVKGKGRIEAPTRVLVESDDCQLRLECDDLVIATGSRPARNREWAEAISTDEIFDMETLPQSLAVVGGGATGIELSTIFSELGSHVILIEAGDRILPDADEEISSACRNMLEKRKIEVHCPARVERISPSKSGQCISMQQDTKTSELDVEKVLTVVGRAPNTESLCLGGLGLESDNGWISVGADLRTSVDHIYAVGDVTGGNLCAHTALAQGIAATERIMGVPSTVRYDLIPRYVSTIPEIAWVGMTEREAVAGGYDLMLGGCPAWANSRSFIRGHKDGFVKIVAEARTGEILGVHIIADHASEIAMQAALAMSAELCLEDLAAVAHPHPSYSEILFEAARSVLGESVHL